MPYLSPSLWWAPAVLGAPWLAAASLQSQPPSSLGLLLEHPSFLSSFYKLLDSGPTLIQHDPILT